MPRGPVSLQTSLPSFQAHQGASFLDSCPSPSSLQGEEQASVWQEQDTLGGFPQSPAVSSWLAEWSWLLVGIHDMKYQDRWVWRSFYPNIHALLASFLALFSVNQWERVQIFLFKKKISILPNLLQYWMFDFSRTLFPFDLISALGDPPGLLWEKQNFSDSENVSSPQSFCFI